MAYDSVLQAILLYEAWPPVNPSATPPFGGSLNDLWLWTGSTWKPLPATPPPPADWGDAVAYDAADDRLVRFGGYLPSDAYTWQTDGTSWTNYPATPAAPSYRTSPALTYDEARSVVVLFGGHHNNPTDDTWLWDGTRWQPIDPNQKPPARESAAMTYDAARRVLLLFGGMGSAGGISQKPLNDTWTWDGHDWHQAEAGSPIT